MKIVELINHSQFIIIIFLCNQFNNIDLKENAYIKYNKLGAIIE